MQFRPNSFVWCVVVCLAVVLAEEVVDNTERDAKEGLPVQYGLMMDAGSTGSRVHTYRYFARILECVAYNFSTQLAWQALELGFNAGGYGGEENYQTLPMTIIMRLDPPQKLVEAEKKRPASTWQLFTISLFRVWNLNGFS